MGLFDWFSSSNAPSARLLKKQVQQVQDRRAQSPDRMHALQELREAIAEAVHGLLRRFDFAYDKSIEDEQEKQWVYDTLIALGPGILPELKTYLLHAQGLSWPLKVLGEVATGDALLEVVRALCERHEPSYARDPSAKVQLLGFVGEQTQDPAYAQLVVPYLQDRDESVRFAAVEALLHQAEPSVGLPALKKHFESGEDTSRRIQARIQEGLA